MGVRGLETFIEQFCPSNVCEKVSIQKLVDDYRKENNGSKPTIIFDAASCLRFLYKGFDWISGGQYKEYLERIRRFVTAFDELGVTSIYFFHRKCSGEPWEKFSEKTYDKLNLVHRAYDGLAKGTPLRGLKQYVVQVPLRFSFVHYFTELFGCEVRISEDYHIEKEMAEFARTNKCFAILGQDTDFLILEGGRYYLSAKHFDIETKTTVCYDQRRLASHLGLHPSQLPVFATLVGNGLVSWKELKPFHRSLCPGFSYKDYFPEVAKYVKQLPLGEELFKVLPDVAERVFKVREYSKIERSIRIYQGVKLPYIDVPLLNEGSIHVRHLDEAGISSGVVHYLLTRTPIAVKFWLEDLRDASIPPVSRLFRPLRQRLYGIILMEQPERIHNLVEERCVDRPPDCVNGPCSIVKVFVKPIPPTDSHPGLLALWGDDRSIEMQNTRWQLFSHAVSKTLDYNVLQNLPDYLLLPTCCLFYLAERKAAVKRWEITALMAAVITLPSVSLDELAELLSDPVDLRAVQIANIFMAGLETIVTLLSVCGYPFSKSKAFKHPYFDGKLFRKKYYEANNQATLADLCDNQELHLELFEKVKRILLQAIPPDDQSKEAKEWNLATV